jgi:hypothetical protein
MTIGVPVRLAILRPEGQRVIARMDAGRWTVVRANYWVAD